MDSEMFESALYESLKLKVLMCQFCCLQMECPPSPRCPKLLECSHTFCFICLRGLVEGTGAFSRVLCPTCGDETKIGASGIVGLGTNLTVIKILEIFQEISQDSLTQLYNGIQQSQNLLHDFSTGRDQLNELHVETSFRKSPSQHEIQNISSTAQQNILNEQRMSFPFQIQPLSFQQQNTLHQESKNENSLDAHALLTHQGNTDIYDTLEFPTKLLGKLIGLRGDTIKGIRERTLCSIEIRKPPKGNLAAPSRVIFRGTPEQIQEAQLLVYDVLIPNSSLLPVGSGTSSSSVVSDTLSMTSFESTDSLDAYGNPYYTYYTPTIDPNEALKNNASNSILLRQSNNENQNQTLKVLTDNTASSSTQDFLCPWTSNTNSNTHSATSTPTPPSYDNLTINTSDVLRQFADDSETPNSYHTAISTNNSDNNNNVSVASNQPFSDNFFDSSHYLLDNNKNNIVETSFYNSVHEAVNANNKEEEDDSFLFQNIMDYGRNLDSNNNNNNNKLNTYTLSNNNNNNNSIHLSSMTQNMLPTKPATFYNQNILQDNFINNNNNSSLINDPNSRLFQNNNVIDNNTLISSLSNIPYQPPRLLQHLQQEQQQGLPHTSNTNNINYPLPLSMNELSNLISTNCKIPLQNKMITSRLECSMERLGRLIGLNGARITEIRNRSQAKIIVTKGLPCKIDFCGTREQIQVAELLVYQALGLKYPAPQTHTQIQTPLQSQIQTRPIQTNINNNNNNNNTIITTTNSLSRSMSKSPACGSTTSDEEFNNFYDSSDATGNISSGGGGGRGSGGPSTPSRNSAAFKFYEESHLDSTLLATAAAALNNDNRHFNIPSNNMSSINNINNNINPSYSQLINPFSTLPDTSASVQQVHMIECPYQKIAAVIGKKGVMINSITEQSGCKISIDQNVPDGAPCKIKLMGLPYQIHCAKDLINSVIASSYSHYSNSNSGRQSHNTSRDQYDSDMEIFSKDIYIPSNLVPLLIGAGGSTVHELQMKSGAHIQVDSDSFTSAPRRVKVSGTVESVNLAVELLQRQLCLTVTEPKSRTNWDELSPQSEGYHFGLDSQGEGFRKDSEIIEDEFVCQHSKVALVIGKRGAVVREIKRRANCHIVIDNTVTRIDSNPGAEGVQRMVFSGTREQVDAGMALVKAVLQVGAVDALDMLTEHVECPHSKVSILIGTNGSTVKEIMKRSNCRIVVHENLNDEPYRIIEMTGTPQQIEIAKGMIASVLDFGSRAVLKSFGGPI